MVLFHGIILVAKWNIDLGGGKTEMSIHGSRWALAFRWGGSRQALGFFFQSRTHMSVLIGWESHQQTGRLLSCLKGEIEGVDLGRSLRGPTNFTSSQPWCRPPKKKSFEEKVQNNFSTGSKLGWRRWLCIRANGLHNWLSIRHMYLPSYRRYWTISGLQQGQDICCYAWPRAGSMSSMQAGWVSKREKGRVWAEFAFR